MKSDATQPHPVSNANPCCGSPAAELDCDADRASERRFRAMTDHAMDLLAVVDGEGRYTYVSGAYERLLGIPPERLVGTSCFDHLHPDDQTRARAALGRALAGPAGEDVTTYRVRRGDGSYLLFEGRGRNLLHDPAVRGIVINSRDITAQHEAEELLRRSEERARDAEAWFRAMIDSGTDLLALIDSDRKFTYISGAYERHLGYRPDEMIGTAALTHVHPDDVAVVGPPLQRVLQTPGAEETVTFRYRAKDGAYRWFEARGRNRLDDPVIRAVVVNSRDVTDRVLAEERLRQSEERAKSSERWFRAMTDNGTDLLMTTDAEGRFTYVSGALERMLGYRAEQMLGRSSTDNLHPDDAASLRGALAAVIAEPGGSGGAVARIRHADGSWRWIESNARNLLYDPAVRAVVVNARDVTEQKQTEQELKLARTAAETAARAKSEFLANMSHELRTPLNGVLGYVQILHADPALTEHQRECLDAIGSCGEQLLSLINDVLDLSKIEAGRLQVSIDTCDVGQVLRAVGNVVRPRAEMKGLRFLTEIGPGLPEAICTDERKLRQILINLLSNAVKFTAAGEVRLEVQADGNDRVCFSVTDTGTGIDPSQLRDIFDPFRQTKIGIREEGTGLGLAISQRLVDAMGGSLEVESEPGRGSRFYFSLPLIEGHLPRRPSGGGGERPDAFASRRQYVLRPAGSDGQRRWPPTILVADDRPTNRQIICQMLRTAGFEIREANNGAEALEALRRDATDLVLMDVRMPVMDGLEATRQIRSDAALASIKVIAVTASVFQEARQQIVEAGFDDMIGKPLRSSELFGQIERHLAHLGVTFVDTDPEPADAGPAEAGTAAVGLPALPPALAGETARRLRDAADIGDFTALGQIATELGTQGGTAAAVGREVGRLARELDFEGIRRLAEALSPEVFSIGEGI
jgi:PAS domain S-box-containing protein